MRYILYPSIAICLVYCSCNKKPQAKPIDEHLKSSFNYKPGTYWIFEDSLSGRIDTFVLTDNTAKTGKYSTGDYDVDIILMTVHLKKNGNVTDSIFWRLELEENNFYLGYRDSRIKTSVNGDYLIYSCPLMQKTFVQDINEDIVTDYLVPSYSILNKTYTNVAFSNHTIDTSLIKFSAHYNNSFYSNEDAGFIKVSIAFPKDSVYHNWQLLDHKIIK